jgi:hypothetical protein
VPLPVGTVFHDRYLAAIAEGRGNMDRIAIALGVFEDAGLRAPLETKAAR